jgi:DNA-binding transcriptional regulator YdaS (Cro superfamily)
MNTLKQKRKGEETMENLRDMILNSPFRTQEKFAVATGIHESIVSKYCRGLRQPSPRHMEVIKRLLVEPKPDK